MCGPTENPLGVPCASFVLRQSNVNCTVCVRMTDECIVGQRDQGSMYIIYYYLISIHICVRTWRGKNLPTPRLDVVLPFACTGSRTFCFRMRSWKPSASLTTMPRGSISRRKVWGRKSKEIQEKGSQNKGMESTSHGRYDKFDKNIYQNLLVAVQLMKWALGEFHRHRSCGWQKPWFWVV